MIGVIDGFAVGWCSLGIKDSTCMSVGFIAFQCLLGSRFRLVQRKAQNEW